MKTKKNIYGTFTSTLFKAIIVFVLMNLPLFSFGQLEKENNLFSFRSEGDVEHYKLTSFVCKHVDGKVYIMFTVLEPSNECLYTIERSKNGKDFDIIFSVKSAKSPNNLQLLNSFIDKKPLDGTSHYRVKRYSTDGCIISSTLIVNAPNLEKDERPLLEKVGTFVSLLNY